MQAKVLEVLLELRIIFGPFNFAFRLVLLELLFAMLK